MAVANAHVSYLESAPHLKHASLAELYRELAGEACRLAGADGRNVRVLDLGAGEGSATTAFLQAGATVVAVDEDADRLEALRARAERYGQRLEVRHGDAVAAAAREPAAYDVVAAVSFLHHVRDYESLVVSALGALRPGGVFLSFQDPLRYASLARGTRLFARCAYLAWRLSRGDLAGGLARYARRRRRGFSDDRADDREEYHAQRGGVDHTAVLRVLREYGVPTRIVVYFSTQSSLFQRIGTALGLANTFAVLGGPVA